MGFSDNAVDPTLAGPATVKETIGNMRMSPQRGTAASVIEDRTGRVRVMGFAAGDYWIGDADLPLLAAAERAAMRTESPILRIYLPPMADDFAFEK